MSHVDQTLLRPGGCGTDGLREFYGNINSLQNLTTTHIHEIRFLGAGDAAARYGMQYGNGVIDIRMK